MGLLASNIVPAICHQSAHVLADVQTHVVWRLLSVGDEFTCPSSFRKLHGVTCRFCSARESPFKKNTRPFASIVCHGEISSVEPYPKLNYSTQLRLTMTFLNCAVKPWKPQNKAEKIEDPNWVHDVIEDTLLSWSGTSCLCFRTRPKSSSADTVCWHPYNIHTHTLAIWKIPPFSSWIHIGLLVTSLDLHVK